MDSYLFIKGLDSINGDVKRADLTQAIPQELFNLPCFNTLGFFKNTINELKKSPYFGESDGLYVKNILSKFPIKVVNLDKRPDRWEQTKKKLDEQGITNYERFSAIDGTKLEMTQDIKFLFRNNDFNYRQGYIGCALSHLKLWNELIRDENNDYYIIMEDDFELVDDFKNKLNITLHQLIQKPFIDLHFLGYFYWKGEPVKSQEYPVMMNMDVKSYMGGTWGYIISKSAAFKLINISKHYGIQNGIDRFMNFQFDKMITTCSEPHIMKSDYVMNGKNVDSDIQRNSNSVGLNSTNPKDDKTVIKFLCDFTDSETICNNIIKNYSDEGIWGNIRVKNTNDADYFVIINKPRIGEYYNPMKTIYIQNESYNNTNINWSRWNNTERMNLMKILTHKNHSSIVSWSLNENYKKLLNSAPEKTEILSSFFSKNSYGQGKVKHMSFIKFFEEKNSSIKCHIFGHNNQEFKNHKNGLKEDSVSPYKYVICVENNFENNYVTEKLYDGILSECLCFYWGAPNIDEIINPQAFIKLDLDNFETAYDTIIQTINNNEWEKRINAIRKEKNRLLKENHFIPVIEKIINQISQEKIIEKQKQKYKITPKIHAGLGNQFFMIANAYATAKDNNMDLILNDSYFGIRKTYWNTIFKNIKTQNLNFKNYKLYKEKSFEYQKTEIDNKNDIILEGYFQSEKFFEKYKNEIKNFFELPEDLKLFSQDKIKSYNFDKEILAVHIRRGDYIGSDLHTIQPIEYYINAINFIKESVDVDILFFTDDKNWVRENFKDSIIVECQEDYEELAVMQQCHHFIITNSSFSWWAAYLSKNENKIIVAPKKWFNKDDMNWQDVYCDNWIKM